MGNIVIPFLAGILTTLSPCVLPVLPFVTASSLGKNRFGPVALAIGLLITFVSTSVLLALSGRVLGLDPTALKKIAGVGLGLSGLLFIYPLLAQKFTDLFSNMNQSLNRASAKAYGGPLLTEFVSGIFLGLVWAPCSGPSLGAAVSLAARTETVVQAVLTLAVFGIGAVLPLLSIAYGTKSLVSKLKDHSSSITILKKIFGTAMVIFGILIFTGLDKALEAQLLGLIPEAWIEFTTKF